MAASRQPASRPTLTWVAQHCSALARRHMGSSNSSQPEPIEMRVSEELLKRVQDKGLLHTCGFIGGKWLQATDRSTYNVRSVLLAILFCAALVHNHRRRRASGAVDRRCTGAGYRRVDSLARLQFVMQCPPGAAAGGEPGHRQGPGHDAEDEGGRDADCHCSGPCSAAPVAGHPCQGALRCAQTVRCSAPAADLCPYTPPIAEQSLHASCWREHSLQW
jgi:hypothetical protein